jgi:hypothetical protein
MKNFNYFPLDLLLSFEFTENNLFCFSANFSNKTPFLEKLSKGKFNELKKRISNNLYKFQSIAIFNIKKIQSINIYSPLKTSPGLVTLNKWILKSNGNGILSNIGRIWLPGFNCKFYEKANKQ